MIHEHSVSTSQEAYYLSATKTNRLKLFEIVGVYSESQSQKLLYDWRFAANQLVLTSSPLRLTTMDLFFSTEPLRQ
jgi:hypothetical protein